MSDKQKELDRAFNTPPETEEEKENPEEQGKEDEEKKVETEQEKDKEEGEEEKTKGTEEGGEAEDEASKKDKWHGKSREEVIKAFKDLEEEVKGSKTPETEKKKDEEEKEEEEAEKTEIPSDDKFAQMTPGQFVKWMLEEIDKKVSKTYEEKSAARDAITREIRETQKDHALLKTSSEYRELVLAIVDTAASKGKTIPLKEACQKVDDFLGKQKGEKETTEDEETRLKKAKAQVEAGGGAPSSPGKTLTKEAERIQKSLEPASLDSPLGGL